MKILIAPDKFRGSLTAEEVIEAVTKGIQQVVEAEIIAQPMADGGEQTAEILAKSTNGRMISTTVHDALFRRVEAQYGLTGDGKMAFIEMAQASGLNMLSLDERNPLKTSTFGTGELIKAAIEQNVERVILCIGGSATNDLGIGMAAALGFKFLDAQGNALHPIGENLIKIEKIDDSNVLPQLSKVQFDVASDVTNLLYGPTGAAYIYGRQKGANDAMIAQLDDGLQHLAQVINATYGLDLQQIAGAGAAGGLGGGCLAFLKGNLTPGVQLVIESLKLQTVIQHVDLVITGEGKTDIQTLSGKVVKGLADEANRYQTPIIAFCGTLDLTFEQIKASGLTAAFSVLNAPMTLAEAQQNAADLLQATVANVMRVFVMKNNTV